MAIVVSTALQGVLDAKQLRAVILADVYLDSGIVRLCDDTRSNVYNGSTYMVGNFAELGSVRTASDLASESISIKIDAARLIEAGINQDLIDDFITALLTEPILRRRVNFTIGIAPVSSENIQHRLPLYAGYITDTPVDSDTSGPIVINMQLDSIASRYGETTSFLRTNESHQSIMPGDLFYQYTAQLIGAEQQLYWGRYGATGTGYTTSGGRSGSGVTPADSGTNIQLF